MPEVVSVDEFIQDEWYPGFVPGPAHAPWAVEPLSTFRKEDESRFWLLDFHYPRGMVPLGYIFPEDGILWASQIVAQALPLPPGKGLAVRMAGPHIYTSEVPTTSSWELASRGERVSRNLPRLIDAFHDTWKERVAELQAGLTHFETFDLDGCSPAEIGVFFDDACAFFKRAWEIHFEIMYPLLAAYVGFYGICSELGIDPAEISKFLQGYDTRIMETDRQLWELTAAARSAGLAPVFARTPPEELLRVLRAADGDAAGWVARFDAFLQEYGWRTEGIADVVLPSWIDDPTSPLGTIKTFLQKDEDHDFARAHERAVAEREAAIDAARSRLTVEEQRRFDEALAMCQRANFAWWNEEHNFYIDLRAHIPLRRAGRALALALGAGDPEDGLFVFRPELRALARGERSWSGLRGLVAERRDYYRTWLERRAHLPKMLGTIPEDMHDPVMKEIFGTSRHFFDALRDDGGDGLVLKGVAVSSGVARGRARVLHGADELHRIQPGEVLVCEATSPNWTPAFAKIAGAVCDSGGTLTHASIVSREYRVPCVTGVGVATARIRDGDEIEVDGSRGVVTILRRASEASEA